MRSRHGNVVDDNIVGCLPANGKALTDSDGVVAYFFAFELQGNNRHRNFFLIFGRLRVIGIQLELDVKMLHPGYEKSQPEAVEFNRDAELLTANFLCPLRRASEVAELRYCPLFYECKQLFLLLEK